MVFTLVGCNSKEDTPVVEEPQQQEEVVESAKEEEPEVVGGYIDTKDKTITPELNDIFTKALEGLLGANYKPQELVATQVVAGTNYKFLAEGTKTTNPITKGTYYIYINEDLQGNISLLDIEVIEEKQEEVKTQDITNMSFWVVVYDQFGTEISRTTAKYGTTIKDPSGNNVVVKGNTYFHTIIDYPSSNDDNDEPTPAPAPTPEPVSDLLLGVFSVSDANTVKFSKGNLQATIDASGNPTVWKFAEHQYDFIGESGANKTIGMAAGDVDLFGWSTAATSHGISTSNAYSDYSGDFADWGAAISDGNSWRTLTCEEWTYLVNTRTNASSLYKCGVTVCGKKCLIIAPDNWDISTNPLQSSYDEASWATAEANGLVCLPSAGYREGSTVEDFGAFGYYWTADAVNDSRAYCTAFSNEEIKTDKSISRYIGQSVRLVKDAE